MVKRSLLTWIFGSPEVLVAPPGEAIE